MSWWSPLQNRLEADAVSTIATDPWSATSPEIPWIDTSDEEGLREVLSLASRNGKRLLPAGAGEHLPAEALRHADAVVSLRRWTRIVDLQPEDLTLVAQAGVTLHDLDSRVAAFQQELAIDCDRGTAATLGGAVAANRSGLHRLVTGSWRDQVLGARVMHVDGTVTRTGSRVVKSVSGYDLAKLYVGSAGSLAFLLEVNLRLRCSPQLTRTVRCPVASGSLIEALQAIRDHPGLEPSCILLVAEPGRPRKAHVLDVVLRFRGRAEAVTQQVQSVLDELGGEELAEGEAQDLSERLRQQMEPVPGRAQCRVVTLPVAIASLAIRWAMSLHEESGFVAQFGVGTASLRLGRADAEEMQRFLQSQPMDPLSFVWEACPREWNAAPLRSRPAAASLHEAVRASFDPQGLLVSRHVLAPAAGSST